MKSKRDGNIYVFVGFVIISIVSLLSLFTSISNSQVTPSTAAIEFQKTICFYKIGYYWDDNTNTCIQGTPTPTPAPSHSLELQALSVEDLAKQIEENKVPEFEISPIIISNVTIKDNLPPSPQIRLYAGYTRYKKVWMAERWIDNKIYFNLLCDGDSILSFQKTFMSDSNISTNVFSNMGEIYPDIAGEILFFIGILREETAQLRLCAFKIKGGRMDILESREFRNLLNRILQIIR